MKPGDLVRLKMPGRLKVGIIISINTDLFDVKYLAHFPGKKLSWFSTIDLGVINEVI
jgi:hypothetical protein